MMAQIEEKVSEQLTEAEIADLLSNAKKGTDGKQDLALLIMRLTFGGFLSGHGSQKLLGWFEGYGLHNTGQAFETMFGLKPGKLWAFAGGTAEFGGGLLTTLGLMHPIGPLMTMSSMAMAGVKVHGGKPIWVDKGGAELPVVYIAIALALTVAGPGKFSLDRLLGIRVPRWMIAATVISEAAMLAYGISQKPMPATES
jgi:putative oxidoreductase